MAAENRRNGGKKRKISRRNEQTIKKLGKSEKIGKRKHEPNSKASKAKGKEKKKISAFLENQIRKKKLQTPRCLLNKLLTTSSQLLSIYYE